MNFSQVFDTYDFKARLLPGVICFVLGLFYVVYSFNTFDILYSFWLEIMSKYVQLTVVFLLFSVLLSILSRGMGKYIIEKLMYSGKTNMPSTTILTSKEYLISEDFKEKIVHKIKVNYNEDVFSIIKSNRTNISKKKDISRIVSMVRDDTRKDRFLKSDLTNYGFWRNLTGSLLFGLVLIVLVKLLTEASWSYIGYSSLIWISLFTLSIYMCHQVACAYAVLLFEKFVHSTKAEK